MATGALDQAPFGTPRARLYAVRARALAYLGSTSETVRDLNASVDELNQAGDDELMDTTGGEMGFDRTRSALCAASAYVALRDGSNAQREAETALVGFAAQPDTARWRADELSAYVDLATARTFAGDLAGAEVALVPVLELPTEHRTEAITLRLENLRRLLGAAPYRGAAEAHRISESVAAFSERALPNTTATIELPSVRALPAS